MGVVPVEGKKGRRWKAVCRVANVPTQSQTFDRKSDATRWHDLTVSQMKDVKNQPYFENRKITLLEVIDRYIDQCIPRKAAKTQKHDIQRLDFWRQSAGHLLLCDFHAQDIEHGMDMLLEQSNYKGRKPPGNATVNKYLKILSACLNVAVNKWRYLDHNPCKGVDLLEEKKSPPRYLKEGQREALLQAARLSDQMLLHDWVVVALDTGGRLSELNALTPARVDLQEDMLYFLQEPEKGRETKTRKSRGIPLTPAARAALVRLCEGKSEEDLLFESLECPGKAVDMKKSLATAVKRSGIGKFRRHDCRHDFVSRLTMKGVHPIHIRELSGHSSIKALEIYAHLSPSVKREAIEKLF